MTISGFTYARNALHFAYPLIESIRSVLPLVDEMIVVIGDSHDGTREAVEAISDPKIRIIDTVWDENLRKNGQVFALQSNIGLDAIKGDWALHIQADEVLHENSYKSFFEAIKKADARNDIDGLLFPYYHFWGDYQHIRNTRRIHPFEIRAFKNRDCIRSYHDSQGFRIYPSLEAYQNGDSGQKLNVLLAEVPVYHYSYSRHPDLLEKKANYARRFWHSDQEMAQQSLHFDFNDVDLLEPFVLSHPQTMQACIATQDWQFEYHPERSNMSFKDRFMARLEAIVGRHLWRYQNYILKK